jgi:hypothetical protein
MKTWPEVANLALHYLAGGVIVGLVAAGVYIGKLDPSLLVATLTAAAYSVGLNLKGS